MQHDETAAAAEDRPHIGNPSPSSREAATVQLCNICSSRTQTRNSRRSDSSPSSGPSPRPQGRCMTPWPALHLAAGRAVPLLGALSVPSRQPRACQSGPVALFSLIRRAPGPSGPLCHSPHILGSGRVDHRISRSHFDAITALLALHSTSVSVNWRLRAAASWPEASGPAAGPAVGHPPSQSATPSGPSPNLSILDPRKPVVTHHGPGRPCSAWRRCAAGVLASPSGGIMIMLASSGGGAVRLLTLPVAGLTVFGALIRRQYSATGSLIGAIPAAVADGMASPTVGGRGWRWRSSPPRFWAAVSRRRRELCGRCVVGALHPFAGRRIGCCDDATGRRSRRSGPDCGSRTGGRRGLRRRGPL